MIYVKVPATSANLGSGFDCISIALNVYNQFWFEPICEAKPRDYANLIERAFYGFYRELGLKENFVGVNIRQDSQIPISMGFGSSAACIVAGILAANALSGQNLDKDEILNIAAKFEGHADNAGAAIFGGIFVGARGENGRYYGNSMSIEPLIDAGLKFGAAIPNFDFPTKKSRAILPKLSAENMHEIVEAYRFNMAHYGLLVAALAAADIEKIGIAMSDKLHQPHRAKFIPEYADVMSILRQNGAVGTFLSGAGPSIFAFYKGENFPKMAKAALKSLESGWQFTEFEASHAGAKVLLDSGG
ncbi:MAG: homoserine kinase [Clostridiales bacterium]|jgi:homoserine kinase|nr:homoserine kinase [Clostridiales bacterium]